MRTGDLWNQCFGGGSGQNWESYTPKRTVPGHAFCQSSTAVAGSSWLWRGSRRECSLYHVRLCNVSQFLINSIRLGGSEPKGIGTLALNFPAFESHCSNPSCRFPFFTWTTQGSMPSVSAQPSPKKAPQRTMTRYPWGISCVTHSSALEAAVRLHPRAVWLFTGGWVMWQKSLPLGQRFLPCFLWES